MSRIYTSLKNRRRKRQTIYSQRYLYEADDPWRYASSGTSDEIKTELGKNIHHMRRQFKRLVVKMQKQNQ